MGQRFRTAPPRYRDRREAGAALAALLGRWAGRPDVTVLGVARGGVPVAAEVAGRLGVCLDVLVVRKLGLPWADEVAFGALGPGGVMVRNTGIADRLDDRDAAPVIRAERAELARQERLYRAGRPAPTLAGRPVLLVDDGLATGATARAAVVVCRRLGAEPVVLAAPVGAADTVATLERAADEVVCPSRPASFVAVGRYYLDFRPVPDAEVRGALAERPPPPVARSR